MYEDRESSIKAISVYVSAEPQQKSGSLTCSVNRGNLHKSPKYNPLFNWPIPNSCDLLMIILGLYIHSDNPLSSHHRPREVLYPPLAGSGLWLVNIIQVLQNSYPLKATN